MSVNYPVGLAVRTKGKSHVTLQSDASIRPAGYWLRALNRASLQARDTRRKVMWHHVTPRGWLTLTLLCNEATVTWVSRHSLTGQRYMSFNTGSWRSKREPCSVCQSAFSVCVTLANRSPGKRSRDRGGSFDVVRELAASPFSLSYPISIRVLACLDSRSSAIIGFHSLPLGLMSQLSTQSPAALKYGSMACP